MTSFTLFYSCFWQKTFFVRRKADPLIEAMTRAMLAADEVAKDIQNANEGLKLNLTGISTDGSLSFGSLSQASEPRLSARLSARARVCSVTTHSPQDNLA